MLFRVGIKGGGHYSIQKVRDHSRNAAYMPSLGGSSGTSTASMSSVKTTKSCGCMCDQQSGEIVEHSRDVRGDWAPHQGI